MKVLQLVTGRRPFFDGQVAALEAAGVECTVCTVPGEHRVENPRSALDYARYYPRVLSALDDHDVVHANYGLTGPFALAQPKRPVVVTLWGTDLMGEYPWLRQLSRLSARLADATVLPSRRMALALGRPYSHVPFGVDTDLFAPSPRAKARERVGWDTDAPVVLFPYAPTRPEKDFSRAETVVSRLDGEVELRVVEGVAHEEMPDYMNASDALLVTSRRESGPMVVKEAAACGLPVVSTDVGFVADVPGTRVCRTTDELVAELQIVLDRPPSTESSIPDSWRLEAMGDRLRRLYEQVLSEHGRRT
ncbi:MAG: glycosyltransferase [Halobacteriota archaeon]